MAQANDAYGPMKASEVIAELTKLLLQYGDIPVRCGNGEDVVATTLSATRPSAKPSPLNFIFTH